MAVSLKKKYPSLIITANTYMNQFTELKLLSQNKIPKHFCSTSTVNYARCIHFHRTTSLDSFNLIIMSNVL